MPTELERSPVIEIGSMTGDSTELDVPHNVFLWNDPVTPMQVVSRVLRKIFEITRDQADLFMITAHTEGKAVVWTGERDQAESYCIQIHAHGLQASVGKDQ